MTTDHRPVEAVEIETGDGVTLRGQRWRGGNGWAVLLHDRGPEEDLDRWRPLVPPLVGSGWSVLALDLRGHGASDGVWSEEGAVADLTAAVGFARAAGGVGVVVIATGASALTALRAGPAVGIDALVLLSPAIDPDQPLAELRGGGEGKLIFVGGREAAPRRAGERLRNASIGWALLVNLPTTLQGTALLGGEHAGHVRDQITRFLAEQRYLATTRAVRPGRSGETVPQSARGTAKAEEARATGIGR